MGAVCLGWGFFASKAAGSGGDASGGAKGGHEDAVLAQALGIGAGHGDVITLGVDTAIVHGGGDGTGGGDKALDLLGGPVAGCQPAGKVAHVGVGTAGEGAHEVGDDKLLAVLHAAIVLKGGEKAFKDVQIGLAHQV